MDYIGRRFGKLTIVSLHPERTARNARRWNCLCDCGNSTIAVTDNLTRGHTRSCGCLYRKHGMHGSAEYTCWNSMRNRCTNPKIAHYPDYGGRGIRVCERWMESFENFYADMGPRPSEDHSIERRDVNGHYEPNNCYWATFDRQASNKRNTVKLTIHGEEMTQSEAGRRFGLSSSVIAQRLKRGHSPEEAISQVHLGAIKYTHDGMTLSLREWAARVKLSYGVLYARINKAGLTIEQALTSPIHRRKTANKEISDTQH